MQPAESGFKNGLKRCNSSRSFTKTVFSRINNSVAIVAALVTLAASTALARAQFVDSGSQPAAKVQAVVYLFPEQVTVQAGKPSTVDLHFRVAQGLHINSHSPNDSFFIATTFSIEDSEAVKLSTANYPPGEQFTLDADPTTKLSVYTGEFVIHAQFIAVAGNHLAQGKLRYQACDHSECMPPKTITVPIDVIAH
jgi:Disulphide bond corrector protein DsbC